MGRRPLLPYNPNTCNCCGCPDFTIEVQSRGYDDAERYGYAGFQAAEVEPPDIINLYRTLVGRGWHRAGDTIGLADYQCTIRDWLNQTPVGLNQGKIWPTPGCWDEGTKFAIPPPSGGGCAPTLLTTCAEGPGHSLEEIVDDAHVTFPPLEGARNPHGLGEARLLDPIPLDDFFAEVALALAGEAWVGYGSAPGAALAYRVERRVAEAGRNTYLYLRKTRFRFRFPVPLAGHYRITWTLEYEPLKINLGAGGGDPAFVVDDDPEEGNEPSEEVQSYQWDGEVPEGYDVEDEETWPLSPWFELPTPPLGRSGRYSIKHLVDLFYDIAGTCVPPEPPEAFTEGGEAIEP